MAPDRGYALAKGLLKEHFGNEFKVLWREEQTTDTVGVASGLGEAFIQQKYKNNVSKGVKCPK